jgi:NTP pyrophosphatase (non-canonical NTP hydrolase)
MNHESIPGPVTDVNPWRPMSEPRDLKTLGKLGEELGECSAAVSRAIIQGLWECEPVTGKSNKLWLEEEIADVLANIHIAKLRFDLNVDFIERRVADKVSKLARWHAML